MELWKQFEEYDLSFADGLEVVVSKIGRYRITGFYRDLYQTTS